MSRLQAHRYAYMLQCMSTICVCLVEVDLLLFNLLLVALILHLDTSLLLQCLLNSTICHRCPELANTYQLETHQRTMQSILLRSLLRTNWRRRRSWSCTTIYFSLESLRIFLDSTQLPLDGATSCTVVAGSLGEVGLGCSC